MPRITYMSSFCISQQTYKQTNKQKKHNLHKLVKCVNKESTTEELHRNQCYKNNSTFLFSTNDVKDVIMCRVQRVALNEPLTFNYPLLKPAKNTNKNIEIATCKERAIHIRFTCSSPSKANECRLKCCTFCCSPNRDVSQSPACPVFSTEGSSTVLALGYRSLFECTSDVFIIARSPPNQNRLFPLPTFTICET